MWHEDLHGTTVKMMHDIADPYQLLADIKDIFIYCYCYWLILGIYLCMLISSFLQLDELFRHVKLT